ncbi:MAG: hypothetical protein ACLFR2_09915 [Candidatus Kapaibacterium sp.]
MSYYPESIESTLKKKIPGDVLLKFLNYSAFFVFIIVLGLEFWSDEADIELKALMLLVVIMIAGIGFIRKPKKIRKSHYHKGEYYFLKIKLACVFF